MHCLRAYQRIAVSEIPRQFSWRCLHQWRRSGGCAGGGLQFLTPTDSRGNVQVRKKQLMPNVGYIIPARQVSSSPSFRDQEGHRVSTAYLGDNLGISVQKHDGNRLVYEVRGQTMLRMVTISFYATAVVGLYLAPDFISSALENEAINTEAIVNLTAVGFAVIGLPSLLRLMSKRLVLKLYHNEARETYMAVTQSLFLTNKLTTFSLQDVVVKEKRSMLSKIFNLTTFKAKKTPLHVNPYNFKLPSDYNHLLGYDKNIYS